MTRLECGQCALQFWWPLQRGTAEWYAEHGTTTADWWGALVRPGHRRFLAAPPVGDGRLLDIGCGHGRFVSLVRDQLGLEVWGLDWDAAAVEFGRRMRGLTHLYAKPLEDFLQEGAGRAFDAVTLFEVLEHQDEPVAFLRRAAGLLKPGGVLAGSVPNRNRLIVGAREGWDYPPQHVLWFDAASLRYLLRSVGLERITIVPLLDASVLVRQVMARFSLGLASTLVRMPEAETVNVTELSKAEWEERASRPAPLGYRLTTALKRAALAPVFAPIVCWAALRSSVRHTLYFEAYRPGPSAE